MQRKLPMFYSAVLLTLVNLLLRLVSTSFQVYISGRIGAAGVGLLQLVMSVSGMAMTAGIAGVRTAAMYLTAEELGKRRPEHVRWVLLGCFGYSLLCSGAVAALLYGFAPALAETWVGNKDTVGALRLFACFLPVTCLGGVMTGYFTAANRITTLAAVEVAEQLCSMAVTLAALTLWAGTDPARACQAVVFGGGMGACLTLLCLAVLRLREQRKHGQRIPVGRRLVQTAVPLALADDLKSGISTAENLMVPRRLALYPGASDPLALFGTVCGMVFPVMMFPAAILYGLNELLIPELARCNAAGSKTRILYLTRRSLRLALLYGLTFSGLLYLLSDTLCLTLYSSADAGYYLRWFAPLVPMLYCDAVTDAMTKGLGQQRVCVRYNIFTSALDVAFLYLLLPKYGIAGYFASFLITHLINFCLSLRRLLRITGQRIPVSVPVRGILSAAGAVWLCAHLNGPVLRTAAYLLVLFCLLTLLQVLQREDGTWLRGLLRGGCSDACRAGNSEEF